MGTQLAVGSLIQGVLVVHIFLGRRRLQHADSINLAAGRCFQICPTVDFTIAAGHQLQTIQIIRASAEVISLTLRVQFVTVEHHINRPLIDQQRQIAPGAGFELGFNGCPHRLRKLFGQHFGQFHFETEQLAGVFRVGINIRSATFLIGSPNEGPPLLHIVPHIGPRWRCCTPKGGYMQK